MRDGDLRRKMGQAGRERVVDFSAPVGLAAFFLVALCVIFGRTKPIRHFVTRSYKNGQSQFRCGGGARRRPGATRAAAVVFEDGAAS